MHRASHHRCVLRRPSQLISPNTHAPPHQAILVGRLFPCLHGVVARRPACLAPLVQQRTLSCTVPIHEAMRHGPCRWASHSLSLLPFVPLAGCPRACVDVTLACELVGRDRPGPFSRSQLPSAGRLFGYVQLDSLFSDLHAAVMSPCCVHAQAGLTVLRLYSLTARWRVRRYDCSLAPAATPRVRDHLSVCVCSSSSCHPAVVRV